MLENFIDEVERRRKRFIVYSSEAETDVVDRLATRNVTVETRPLPPGGPDPFVAIHEGGRFVGVIALEDLEMLLAPPIVRPGDPEGLSEGYRVLMEVLEETLFAALSRRQLLAASREIEDRALRVGTGELRVGFQSLSAFESQVPVYRTLGTETALTVHVRGRPDWEPPDLANVTYHREAGALAPFWYLAFDGGTDPDQACALVGRQRNGEYVGFWTYDPEMVEDILATLRSAPG